MPLFKAYFCPTELTPESILTDGEQGEPFRIEGSTWLVWLDLNPGRFCHPTAYMFITRKGEEKDEIRAEGGQWWPVLNGDRILYRDTEGEPSQINCYFFPDALTHEDVLYDGEKGPQFDITGPTRLIWIDLQPGAKFGHPTVYVFISAAGIQIKPGGERPVLNGSIILYDTDEFVTMQLPLALDVPSP